MKKLLGWIILPTVFLIGGQAFAATVFDLRGSGEEVQSFDLVVNGITATVTGRYFTGFQSSNLSNNGNGTYMMDGLSFSVPGSSTYPYPKIGRWSSGAGVINSPNDSSHTVDGYGYDDFIQIVFSEAVSLTSADFSYFDINDDYRIMYDFNKNGTLDNGDIITYKLGVDPFAGVSSLIGVESAVWGFAATDGSCSSCGIDDWKLAEIHVELGEPQSPSAVPLPPAALLFGSALVGAGIIGRKKKKT